MAVRQGMTVYDLEHQELAYAPPFGSAKDPVNMAGFVASNVLRGDLRLWYAEDFPAATDGARLVDVRTPEAYGSWHIPGAVNIPLATLRDVVAAGGLDPAQPVRLYCAVGFRSYLAHRVLAQRGFADVATLSGGSTTFRAVHEKPGDTYEALAPVVAYAEAALVGAGAAPVGATAVDLDCTGLACPGPIMRLAETMADLRPGDEVRVTVSDPGFALDAPAWAAKNGHRLVEIAPRGAGFAATIRKGGAPAATPIGGAPAATPKAGAPAAVARNKTSMVVFSGDLDKLIAAFIIGNGALAMGERVSVFFTFWGLNALRRPDAPKRDKSALERVMSVMMPAGAEHLPLSAMNFGGAGAAMIKRVMRDHNVPDLSELIASAQRGGARLIGCTMTMELLGIAESDLIDGVELGGVATFLGEASESGTTLFI